MIRPFHECLYACYMIPVISFIFRKKNIPTIFLLASAALFSVNSPCQPLNQGGSFSISTNLIKILMGILNVELEYNITPAISIKVFGEVLAFDYVYDRSKHPDVVIRSGPYYHFLVKTSDNQDLQLGPFAGYAWSKTNVNMTGLNTGLELGYKYQFNNSFYLFPKGLITYPFHTNKPFPGLELLVGKVLN